MAKKSNVQSAPADTTKKKKSSPASKAPADTTKKKKSSPASKAPADTTKKKKSSPASKAPADTTEKKDAPVVRSRCFNLILYPDCEAHMDILYYLTGDNPEKIKGFFIYHKGEKELDKNGSPVLDDKGNVKYEKDHYHCVITYHNARTIASVHKAFSKLVSYPCINAISDINSYYMYLLHRTYDCFTAGKTVYQPKDIKPLGNDSVEYLAKVSGLKNDTVSTVQNLFECAKVSSSALDMLQIILDNYGEKELKTLMKNAYFCKTFMLGGK